MKTRIFQIMLLLTVLSGLTVFLLYSMVEVRLGGGFTRTFSSLRVLQAVDTLDVNFDSYYIAGHTTHHVFLGNTVAPRRLLMINVNSLDVQRIELHFNYAGDLRFWALRVKVDSPMFYMGDGSTPAILGGMLNDGNADLLTNQFPFLEFQPVNHASFAIRSVSRSRMAKLGLLRLDPFEVKFDTTLLQKQIDGVFCTDGVTLYDREKSRLVYLYYYRNQYIVMDSTLSFLYRANTIDTTTRAKIKIDSIPSDNSYTIASPPLVVNRRSAVSNNRLFVNSTRYSDNERYRDLEHFSVIDVYNLQEGQYEYSFYVPRHNGEAIDHFAVIGNRLLALYKRNIILYDFTNFTTTANKSDTGKYMHVNRRKDRTPA